MKKPNHDLPMFVTLGILYSTAIVLIICKGFGVIS